MIFRIAIANIHTYKQCTNVRMHGYAFSFTSYNHYTISLLFEYLIPIVLMRVYWRYTSNHYTIAYTNAYAYAAMCQGERAHSTHMAYLVSKRFVPFNVSSHSAIYLGALVVKNQCEGTFDLNVCSSHSKLVQLCDCSCADLPVSFGFGLGRKLFSLSLSVCVCCRKESTSHHSVIWK